MAIGIQRASLPAEFFDSTSATLLRSPEPQYLHARLILAAMAMDLDAKAGLAMPVPGRALPSGAGYISLPEMQFELSDPIAAAAVRVMTDFAPGSQTPGHTIRFNRPRFTDSTYTFASREISAGATISTTPVNVGSDQVPLTVKRWAGPYDATNNRVAPYQVNRFDSGRAIHSLSGVAELHFMRDFHKTIDSFGVLLWNSVKAANIVYPAGMTAVDDALAVGSHPMDYATLALTQRRLDDANIPQFPNGKRIMVLTTLQTEQLTRDSEYQRLSVFERDFNPLLKGSYVGSCGNFDILKSTTLTQTNNSSSIPIQYGQAFGPGMVGVGPASMPAVVPNSQDNYGEDVLAIWLFYCAFGVLDDSFGCSIRTS